MRAWGSLNPPFANVETRCTRSGLTVLVGHPRSHSKRNVEWGWCRGRIVGPETYLFPVVLLPVILVAQQGKGTKETSGDHGSLLFDPAMMHSGMGVAGRIPMWRQHPPYQSPSQKRDCRHVSHACHLLPIYAPTPTPLVTARSLEHVGCTA